MPRRKRPVLGVDYIMDTDGRAQFTREYLIKRGGCCEHDCRYCPYERCGTGLAYQLASTSNPITLNGAPLAVR